MRGRGPFFRKAPSLALLPGKTASKGEAGGETAYPRCPYRTTSKGYANGKAPDDICCEKICQEQNALGSKKLISLAS